MPPFSRYDSTQPDQLHPSVQPPNSSHPNGSKLKQHGNWDVSNVPGRPIFAGSLEKYLEKQLSVEKLNDIHLHLWWAGRPGNIRPLHQQVMMKREVLITENINLHLVWFDTTIYIKPLPEFILHYDFFLDNFCTGNTPELQKLANGFLATFTKLIQHPSDFDIAVNLRILPSGMEWETWNVLATSLQRNLCVVHDANKRYRYGELRLRRLNHIYRFLRGGRPYYSVYLQYDHFFSQNFAWMLLLMVYLSVILGAMQVVLSLENVPKALANASYLFSVVALILIGGTLVLQALLFVVLFLYHLVCTIDNLRKESVPWVLAPNRTKDSDVEVPSGVKG